MALNPNVSNVLDRHMRQVTVKIYASEVIANNGEVTDNTPITATKNFAILPISAKELQILPEGLYDKFDRKFYSKDTHDLPNESILEVGSEKFKIISRDDRSFEGGFTAYYAKKVLI